MSNNNTGKLENSTATVPEKSSQNLSYTGTVKVSIKDSNNKTISTRKHHNEGSIDLFKFFAHCVAAEWNAAQELRPNKICLISAVGATLDDIKETFKTGSQVGTTPISVMSALVATYDKATLEVASDGNEKLESYKATLHFRLPYSYIQPGWIYGIVLFSANTSSVDTDKVLSAWEAYYLFTKEEDNTIAWDPLPISAQQSYNLIIDWELSVGNPTAGN